MDNISFPFQLESVAARPEVACLYYPELRSAVAQAVLTGQATADQVDAYLAAGWRRFGNFYFKDDCPDCRRCIPLRVSVAEFHPGKRQRRILRKGGSFEFRIFSPGEFADRYLEESYRLYNHFRKERYGLKETGLQEFLYCYFLNTGTGMVSALFDRGRLIGCGWLDRGGASLSTVYYAFDPEYSSFSPGILSILLEIHWAAAEGVRHYYLGYWMQDLSCMAYKGSFRPAEVLDFATGAWSPVERCQP